VALWILLLVEQAVTGLGGATSSGQWRARTMRHGGACGGHHRGMVTGHGGMRGR
jgi:hypothetical protein